MSHDLANDPTALERDRIAAAGLLKEVVGLHVFERRGSVVGQQFAVLKLSKSGKNKLSRLSKATVTVAADIPFGSPASAKAKLK